MSKRIEEILGVIEEVRGEFQNRTGYWSITPMRIRAVESVANRRGIEKQTVLDKFIRQLQPDINVASDFDRLLEDWLIHDSDELKNILLKHTSDHQDVELIGNTIYKVPELDSTLAHEFGYEPNEESFKEGKDKLRLHLTKERNRSLIRRAKRKWGQEQKEGICCSICSFSFLEVYGRIGEGFIEAHHTESISSLALDTVVHIADLVPICSNCHSMIHCHRPWLTVEQLHTIVSERLK